MYLYQNNKACENLLLLIFKQDNSKTRSTTHIIFETDMKYGFKIYKSYRVTLGFDFSVKSQRSCAQS